MKLAGVKLPASYQPDGVSQLATLKGKGKLLREKPLFWKTVAPLARSQDQARPLGFLCGGQSKLETRK